MSSRVFGLANPGLHGPLLAARNADLAMIDWLTGLLNRRGFFRAAGDQQLLDGHRGVQAAVIVLDIDHFKKFSDRYGHAAGDRISQALGNRLRTLVPSSNLLARMGGEAFCVVLPETTLAAATALAESIRVDCTRTTVAAIDDPPIRYTLSLGVCQTMPQLSLDQALLRADEALYAAKRNGCDQVVGLKGDDECAQNPQ